MTPEDESEMKGLFIRAFLAMYRASQAHQNFLDEEIRERLAVEDFDNVILPDLRKDKSQLYLTAKLKNQLVGYALFQLLDEKTVFLVEMAVAPEYWGNGLGTKMTFSILEQWRSLTKMVLLTEKYNKIAQRFYESKGFRPSPFCKEGFSSERFRAYEIVFK